MMAGLDIFDTLIARPGCQMGTAKPAQAYTATPHNQQPYGPINQSMPCEPHGIHCVEPISAQGKGPGTKYCTTQRAVLHCQHSSTHRYTSIHTISLTAASTEQLAYTTYTLATQLQVTQSSQQLCASLKAASPASTSCCRSCCQPSSPASCCTALSQVPRCRTSLTHASKSKPPALPSAQPDAPPAELPVSGVPSLLLAAAVASTAEFAPSASVLSALSWSAATSKSAGEQQQLSKPATLLQAVSAGLAELQQLKVLLSLPESSSLSLPLLLSLLLGHRRSHPSSSVLCGEPLRLASRQRGPHGRHCCCC